jgi:hypothetical protein
VQAADHRCLVGAGSGIDNLQVRRQSEPRSNGELVEQLDALFIVKRDHRVDGVFQVVAKLVVEAADAEAVERSRRNDAMTGETAHEIGADRVGVPVSDGRPAVDAALVKVAVRPYGSPTASGWLMAGWPGRTLRSSDSRVRPSERFPCARRSGSAAHTPPR